MLLPSAQAGGVPTRMECWYPTGIRSFEIDRASRGGIAAKERVNFFIREQPLHLSACIDQFLTGATRRRRRLGLRQRVERFCEELVEVVELTALEVALDAGLGFGSCDLKGQWGPPGQNGFRPPTVHQGRGAVNIECYKGRYHTLFGQGRNF